MREVLVGLAEQAADVSLVSAGGRSHRVRVTGVGEGVVVASTDAGPLLVIGIDAIVGVVTHRGRMVAHRSTEVTSPSGPDDEGYTAMRDSWTMRDILSRWLDSRPRITTWWGAETLTGTLVAVGRDLATVEMDGTGGVAYVRLDSTTEISVPVSSSL